MSLGAAPPGAAEWRKVMEMDKWISGYKVRSFPWIDGKHIYFNVQYYKPGQSIEKPPESLKKLLDNYLLIC